MQILTGSTQFRTEAGRTVVTLGKFDGLHRGHQKIFQKMQEIRQDDEPLVVFTFDFAIRSVLSGHTVQNLFTDQERRELFEAQGTDILVECPFTEEIRMMEPEKFVEKILMEQLHAACIIIGEDFHFGYQRRGDAALLDKLSGKYGYTFIKVEKERDGAREISSTYIREELLKGNMEKVTQLLGFPYFLKSDVLHGRQLGGRIGSPTVNQIPSDMKLLPPFGVYYTLAETGGRQYPAITNIGCKPTVTEERIVTAETYLLDFHGDLYGETVKISLFHFARAERKFPDIPALQAQIQEDAKQADSFWKRMGTL